MPTVVRHLDSSGIRAAAIHGNKSQPQREQALAAFRAGDARVLVATDIAARGIDIERVSHVINFELPNVPEDYVHRIGRTARAGTTGVAIAFCSDEERPYLRGIERLTRRSVRVGGVSLAAVGKAPAALDPTPLPGKRDTEPRSREIARMPQSRKGMIAARNSIPAGGLRREANRQPRGRIR